MSEIDHNNVTWRELMMEPGWRTPAQYDPDRDGPFVAVSPSEAALDVRFDGGFGTSEGPEFTAWTATRVYFPVVYDGAESVGSAPRNPCDEVCSHVGGQ